MDESKGRPWRSELAKARLRMGMSQEEAAEAVGVSPTTWSRWECGEQSMRPVYRVRISEVFNADPMTVERWLDSKTPTETPMSHLADLGSGSAEATVESFEHLWRCDVDPSRRHMLATLPFVPAVLGEWLASIYDTPDMPSAVEKTGRLVGRSDVTRISEAQQAFTQMDHQFGAGLVRPAIVDYLNTNVKPLLHGRYDGRTGRELMTAAAGMTLLAGWTAFDLSHHGQAQHYIGQGLRLAKAGDDPLTTAWLLQTSVRQAIHLNEGTWAVRLARAATDTARKAQAPPRVMALLLIKEAWATALQAHPAQTRDKHAAKRVQVLLTEAEQEYAKGPTDRDPAWVAWHEDTELNAEAAQCWRLIGDYERAATFARTAVRVFSEQRPRSAQLNQIHLAEVFLDMGDLEPAIESARATIPGAKQLASTRLIERIKRFDNRLGPYSTSIQVREFRSYLATEIAA